MRLSDEQTDALTELVNIGVGHAASTLNELIGHKICLVIPHIKIISIEEVINNPDICSNESISAVSMAFRGNFNGNASLLFPLQSASTLVSVLNDEPTGSAQLDELRSGTLAEVGNILLNGVMGSIGNMLEAKLNYSVPSYHECSLPDVLGHQRAEAVLLARANFYIDELCIKGNILLCFEVESLHALIKAVDQALTV